jgi:hypothetical protein
MAKVAIVNRDTGFLTDICDEEDKFEIYEGLDAQFKWCEVPDDATYEHVMVNGVVIHRSEREDLRIAATIARQVAYGDIGNQMDMQYKDALDGGTRWADHIARVKAENQSPSSIPEFVPNPKHTQLEGRASWDPWVDNWVPPH